MNPDTNMMNPGTDAEMMERSGIIFIDQVLVDPMGNEMRGEAAEMIASPNMALNGRTWAIGISPSAGPRAR